MDEMMRYIFSELKYQNTAIRRLKTIAVLTTIYAAAMTYHSWKEKKTIERLDTEIKELREKGE